MSWSITVNNLSLDSYTEVFKEEVIARFISHNPEYAHDLGLALAVAIRAGLKSATLAGGRTPTPGSDDEFVTISIVGMGKATDFNDAVKKILGAGPDDIALIEQANAHVVTEG